MEFENKSAKIERPVAPRTKPMLAQSVKLPSKAALKRKATGPADGVFNQMMMTYKSFDAPPRCFIQSFCVYQALIVILITLTYFWLDHSSH
jgi:hypothetical protein